MVVEAPSYLGAIMAFRGHHADFRTVPMDADDLDVGALAAMLGTGIRPKLLYTIPDHHNPTGISLSARWRRDLVELSRRYGVLLVEDVAYRDLSFSGDREDSLWSLAPDVVVRIGTFSKIFFPGCAWGGRPGHPRWSTRWSPPSRTPTSARGPSVSNWLRRCSAAASSTGI